MFAALSLTTEIFVFFKRYYPRLLQVTKIQALPARMLIAVPATTTMAISEIADWVVTSITRAHAPLFKRERKKPRISLMA